MEGKAKKAKSGFSGGLNCLVVDRSIVGLVGLAGLWGNRGHYTEDRRAPGWGSRGE